jgi:hypothetical protein
MKLHYNTATTSCRHIGDFGVTVETREFNGTSECRLASSLVFFVDSRVIEGAYRMNLASISTLQFA